MKTKIPLFASTPSASTGGTSNLLNAPSAIAKLVFTKKQKKDPKKALRDSLFKEMLECLEKFPNCNLTLPNGAFIGSLVIHNDEEISNLTIHFFQRLIIYRPDLRCTLLKNMVSILQKILLKEIR
jgi:hypothetical protein